jgi:hypothetical protein
MGLILRAGMRHQRFWLAAEAVIALGNRPLGQFRGAVLEAVTSDVRHEVADVAPYRCTAAR